MSLGSLREMYDPSRYRVSEYRYPPGAKFPGRTRAVRWFVLGGTALIGIPAPTTITAGDVVEIDAGEYSLEVVGAEELSLVMVWDIAPFMN